MRLGLWLKMKFTAISVVSWSGILIKRLVTSYKVRNFVERFTFLIWETKQKVSLDKELKAKEDQKVKDKIIIKSTYRSNNRSKWITRKESVHFRSTIDTRRSKTRRIKFIALIFIKKDFLNAAYCFPTPNCVIIIKLSPYLLSWRKQWLSHLQANK